MIDTAPVYLNGASVKTAVIILFHGSRAEGSGATVHRITAEVRRRGHFGIVATAFLQNVTPDLRESIAFCIQQGAEKIVIVPFFLQLGGHVTADIPLLVDHFLKKFQKGKMPIRVEPEVMEQLKTFSWPGNVRELANIIQQMMVFCRKNTITVHDVPPHLFLKEGKEQGKEGGRIQLMKMVSDLERKWIVSKLMEADWNQEKAATFLGITRKMLANRINKYHLKPKKSNRGPNSKAWR